MTIWQPVLANYEGPLYRRIADALADDIATGALPPGYRLPTHRDLAERLDVTVGTVSRAYAQAEQRGLIQATVGRGTFVHEGSPTPANAPTGSALLSDLYPQGTVAATEANATTSAPATLPVVALADRSATDKEASLLDNPLLRLHALDHLPISPDRLDLSLNYPSDAPMAVMLAAAMKRIFDPAVLTTIARYHPSNGIDSHREAGSQWLSRPDMRVPASELLITPGCQGGISMALSAFCRPGDVVLHEALTWPGLQGNAMQHVVTTRGVAMDQEGLRPDAFEKACRTFSPRFLYTMPNLHNPTTIVLSEERRRQIAEIAVRYDVMIIEDDVYGFLLDDPPPTIRLFAPEHVIYVTSLSKSLAPGLRVGYLWASPTHLPRLAAAIRNNQMMTSTVASEIASEAIFCGAAREAAQAQRDQARARQRLMRETLTGFDLRAHPSAFQAWMRIPEPWSSDSFIAALADRGVTLAPGSVFSGDPPAPDANNHIRLCLCAIPDIRHLALALKIIADVGGKATPVSLPMV